LGEEYLPSIYNERDVIDLADKYWEKESPSVVEVGRNVLKIFFKSRKIQVFKRIDGTANGLSKGVTLDLDQMNRAELEGMKVAVTSAIEEAQAQVS
jgi:hypothetical protein